MSKAVRYGRNVTPELGPDDKRMRLRYAGTCRMCGDPLASGTDAVYERTTKTVRCIECRTSTASESESGLAGTSARREHDRRVANREARIRAAHPRIGGLILALSDEPQSIRAWERGAIGEEMLADRLKDLPESFCALHDRRIPGTRSNIDHIVIGPTGVWVIDAKRYKNQRPSLQVEGRLFGPRVETLRVGGRPRTNLIAGVRGQVERVVTALDDDSIPVSGVLCFIEADWPLIGGSFTVNGMLVAWPRFVVKHVADAVTAAIDVRDVHARLTAHFPRA